MKKIFITGLLLICLFLLSGCDAAESKNDSTSISVTESSTSVTSEKSTVESSRKDNEPTVLSEQSSDKPESSEEEQTHSNTLVVYFSRTGEQYGVGMIDKGNTAIVADMIAEQTGADTFEVLPQEDYYPYTYNELTEVAKKELNENARPAIAGEIPDLTKYDTIFLGAPVWWGDWPMIMYTFFEENTEVLAGKTLIPFSTHAGSGLSGFDSKLSAACPNSNVGEGLAVAGTDAQSNRDSVRQSISSWIAELKY